MTNPQAKRLLRQGCASFEAAEAADKQARKRRKPLTRGINDEL